MTLLPLTLAIADYPHTRALRNRSIAIEGVAPTFANVTPQIAAYRRMVRQVEFDVCELAPTTYLIARAYGAPFVALPIFVTRRFHHSGLLVRSRSLIRGPKDLEGQNVGVRAWSVTTGVWTRGGGRKIASIGIHVKQWVTWHGFALNVTTDLADFDRIVPCGIQGVEMTSVEREAPNGKRGTLWEESVAAVVNGFEKAFGASVIPCPEGSLPRL